MVRNLVAAIVACVYVAGSIWLVSREGQAYRASLSQTKTPATVIEATSTTAAEGTKKTVPSVDSVDRSPPRLEPEITKTAPARAAVADAPRKPGLKNSSADPSPTRVAMAIPVNSPVRATTATHPAVEKSRANPLASDPFWSQDRLARAWDITYFKIDDELRMRDELHELIVRFNPLVKDASPWLSRVEDLAAPFRQGLHRKEIKYHFYILDSDVVNAFSIPGGNVYISRALFDLIGDDEDYALQFAIGHEIAHVDLEHAIQCLRDPGVKRMTEGTLQKLYMLVLPYGYLRNDRVDPEIDQEFDADEWVAKQMGRLGRSRREILVFLTKLEGYSKKHGFSEGRDQPQAGRDLSPLENHYRAQTAPRRRLKHLKEFLDQSAKSQK